MSHKLMFFVLLLLLGAGLLQANNALYFDGVDDCVQVLSPGISTVFTCEFCLFCGYRGLRCCEPEKRLDIFCESLRLSAERDTNLTPLYTGLEEQ